MEPSQSNNIDQIRAAAKDALSRGFAILACEPHAKSPWAKYSEHAVNSATFDPVIALRPWNDGHEANYGIACGKSNLTVIDCDKGLNSVEEFEKWRQENNLPETFTVLSGREGFGVHMYYSGTIPTTSFDIGGVTGEYKSVGGYVVGPGSIHPSGKRYTVLKDVDLVPFPEELKNAIKGKKKLEHVPATLGGEKIAAGNRWAHLQALAGKLKSVGLSEEAIYISLWDFLKHNCEDGESYDDDKVKALAAWAASDACEGGTTTVVKVGGEKDYDPEEEAKELEEPFETITGDAIGDLSVALTNGTFIPPAFARATIKSVLAPVLDGVVAFPKEETLHMRMWNGLVSSHPEMGKGVIWKRVMMMLGDDLVSSYGVKLIPSGFFSSGEHAMKVLAQNDGSPHLVHFDEMRTLFEKGGGKGSTLFSRLLSLYESKEGSAGSLSNDACHFTNLSLSMTGGFTSSSFNKAATGVGAGGDGFLSRMILSYSNGVKHHGDWEDMKPEDINKAVAEIHEAIKWAREKAGFEKTQIGATKTTPVILTETPEALALRKEFQEWLATERKRLNEQHPDVGYVQRIESHFKRDLLFRALCTPEHTITAELTAKSIVWAKHQLKIRLELWPSDFSNSTTQAEQKIIQALRASGPLSKAKAQNRSHVERMEGGYRAWNDAWRALLQAEVVTLHSTHKYDGKVVQKWGIRDWVWVKETKTWLKG